MDTTTLLIIVLIVLLLGGAWYGRGRCTKQRPYRQPASNLGFVGTERTTV